MRVIIPLRIDESMFTSSTAVEPAIGESAYNSGTTYAVGDRVILGSPTSTVTISNASPAVVTWAAHGQAEGTRGVFTTTGTLPAPLLPNTVYYIIGNGLLSGSLQVSATLDGAPIATTSAGSGTHTFTTQVHRVYESLQATNVGKYPTIAAYVDVWWTDIGPSNKYAMLDYQSSFTTSVASPLTFTLTPGKRVNSIAFLGMIGTSITVSMTSVGGGGTVYTSTTNLSTRYTTRSYEYCFGTFSNKKGLVISDLPPYTDGIITVTLANTGGNAEMAAVVIGSYEDLGRTQYSANSNILNFSKIDRDDFGKATLNARPSIPKTTQVVYAPKTKVNRIRALRVLLDAVPAVYYGLTDSTDLYFESLLVLGVYKRFDIDLEQFAEAKIDLEVEAITS